MTSSEKYPFILTFDPKKSNQYPYGYWYIKAGDYDTDGEAIDTAMAKLIILMNAALERGEKD